MLTATRDYVPLLDPAYKAALGLAYTVCLPKGTQHVIKHEYFNKRNAPVQDLLSFLKARRVLAEGEPSGQLSELQIGLDALAVMTTWTEREQPAPTFFHLSRAKKLQPYALEAANRMAERALSTEWLYLPQ